MIVPTKEISFTRYTTPAVVPAPRPINTTGGIMAVLKDTARFGSESMAKAKKEKEFEAQIFSAPRLIKAISECSGTTFPIDITRLIVSYVNSIFYPPKLTRLWAAEKQPFTATALSGNTVVGYTEPAEKASFVTLLDLTAKSRIPETLTLAKGGPKIRSGLDAAFTSIAYGNDFFFLVTATNTIEVFSKKDQELLRDPRPIEVQKKPLAIQFDSLSNRLFICLEWSDNARDTRVTAHNMATRISSYLAPNFDDREPSITSMPEGGVLIVTTQQIILDGSNTIGHHSHEIASCSTHVATSSYEGEVTLWNVPSLTKQRTFDVFMPSMDHIALNEHHIAMRLRNNAFLFMDVASGNETAAYKVELDPIVDPDITGLNGLWGPQGSLVLFQYTSSFDDISHKDQRIYIADFPTFADGH